MAEAVPQGMDAEHEEPTDEFDRFWQSPQKRAAQAPVAEAERSPLPTKERTSSGDTVAETFTAVPQSQVKDGVVVRLFSLTNTHTSRRYRQAVRDVFGVSCNLDDYQVNRGWYHIQVPKVTVHGMQRSRAWCGTPPILGVVNMVGTRNFTCYMGAL